MHLVSQPVRLSWIWLCWIVDFNRFFYQSWECQRLFPVGHSLVSITTDEGHRGRLSLKMRIKVASYSVLSEKCCAIISKSQSLFRRFNPETLFISNIFIRALSVAPDSICRLNFYSEIGLTSHSILTWHTHTHASDSLNYWPQGHKDQGSETICACVLGESTIAESAESLPVQRNVCVCVFKCI